MGGELSRRSPCRTIGMRSERIYFLPSLTPRYRRRGSSPDGCVRVMTRLSGSVLCLRSGRQPTGSLLSRSGGHSLIKEADPPVARGVGWSGRVEVGTGVVSDPIRLSVIRGRFTLGSDCCKTDYLSGHSPFRQSSHGAYPRLRALRTRSRVPSLVDEQ